MDGTVKTFNLNTGENISIFVGHKSEITALAYDMLGHRLATGAKVKILCNLLEYFCDALFYNLHRYME